MLQLEQLVVDLALEGRRHTGEVERYIEGGPLLGEVRLQLLDGVAQLRWPCILGIRVTVPRKWTELDPAHSMG